MTKRPISSISMCQEAWDKAREIAASEDRSVSRVLEHLVLEAGSPGADFSTRSSVDEMYASAGRALDKLKPMPPAEQRADEVAERGGAPVERSIPDPLRVPSSSDLPRGSTTRANPGPKKPASTTLTGRKHGPVPKGGR